MQVHFLVLDALPQALDKEVVAPGASTVHAELDPVVLHSPDEGRAGELAALVGVQDPGAAVVPDRRRQGIETAIPGQGVRQAPG
jgi:hypothetical protein